MCDVSIVPARLAVVKRLSAIQLDGYGQPGKTGKNEIFRVVARRSRSVAADMPQQSFLFGEFSDCVQQVMQWAFVRLASLIVRHGG